MAVLPPLRIRVRLFAMQRETAGMKELRLEVPLGSTVDDAWNAVVATVPALAPGRAFLRFAVNGVYADPGTALADGDEVACIPPVSGGADDDDLDDDAGGEPADEHAADETDGGRGKRRILEIRAEPFPADLLASLVDRLATNVDGGVVAFLGRTRVTPGTPAPGQEAAAAQVQGKVVEGLEYEAFEPLGIKEGERILAEAVKRFGVTRALCEHRVGELALGDVAVWVGVSSPHRDEAFRACRFIIDEVKHRVPIWKKEHFADGEVWVEGDWDDRIPSAG